jgi:hypothetical protein
MNERVNELTAGINALSTAQEHGHKCGNEMSRLVSALTAELVGSDNGHQPKDDRNYIRYKYAIKELTGNPGINSREKYLALRTTNKQIYAAFEDVTCDHADLYFARCSGVTTSAAALSIAFDNVVIVADSEISAKELRKNGANVVSGNIRGTDFADKTVIFEAGVQPTETNALRTIKIYAVDIVPFPDHETPADVTARRAIVL